MVSQLSSGTCRISSSWTALDCFVRFNVSNYSWRHLPPGTATPVKLVGLLSRRALEESRIDVKIKEAITGFDYLRIHADVKDFERRHLKPITPLPCDLHKLISSRRSPAE
jgi:hypothetical protein